MALGAAALETGYHKGNSVLESQKQGSGARHDSGFQR